MDFAITAVIGRWFQEMMDVSSVPLQLGRGHIHGEQAKKVEAGRPACVCEEDGQDATLQPGDVLLVRRAGLHARSSEFSACHTGVSRMEQPMLGHADNNGRVNGNAWVEWATLLCRWVDLHRGSLGVDGHRLCCLWTGPPREEMSEPWRSSSHSECSW